MMQGDEYLVPIEISTSSGIATAEAFTDVEIMIGNIRKTLKDSQITYDPSKQAFMFPLTQEETFKLQNTAQPVQVRVKTTTGEVIGTQVGNIDVTRSMSRKVL